MSAKSREKVISIIVDSILYLYHLIVTMIALFYLRKLWSWTVLAFKRGE